MQHAKYDLVFFDCDGTLTDTGPTHIRWCNDINNTRKYGLPNIDPNSTRETRKILGTPMEIILRNYGFPEKDIEGLTQLYQQTFSQDPAYTSYIFTHVSDLLHRLRTRKVNTGVITSNVLANIRRDLATWADSFALIIDKTQLDKNKWTKADGLIWAKEHFGSNNPVYVGDTSKDRDAAKKANWPFIWAAYGWEEPSQNQQDVARNIPQLAQLLGIRI